MSYQTITCYLIFKSYYIVHKTLNRNFMELKRIMTYNMVFTFNFYKIINKTLNLNFVPIPKWLNEKHSGI